ncbi:MAG: DoxX family protein [Firmicutes bacterium]|nr:DoxX family protein [Bacillota bacterium]
MLIGTYLDKYRDTGLLVLRIGFGLMFMYHGFPKIVGGVEKWAGLGGAMSAFGITFLPAFWGFMAAFSEFFGGLLLLLGFFFRPANVLLAITMIVAVAMKFNAGEGLFGASHALEAGILFISLIFIGPGEYSLDERLGDVKKIATS